MSATWQILVGDVRNSLKDIPDGSVQTCVTSPPYWGLRDYGVTGQIGLEPTPDEYVATMVEVFREVRRVLKDDGTLFLNLGDSYASSPKGNPDALSPGLTNMGRNAQQANNHRTRSTIVGGLKPKDLVGIPWRVAFALQADGWWLRSDIIWCLSGGASVYARTQKGDMPIMVKDLVRLEPSTVKLWNGSKWTQVLGWSQSPEPRDGALEIELRSGERIGCTGGHQWPTQRGNVTADALVVGDVIATTQLPAPDAPVFPQGLTGADDDVGWLCGLYLAEGSMSGKTVQLAGHRDHTEHRMVRLERIAAAYHGSVRAHIYGHTATICLDGPVIAAVIRAYIHGDTAKRKGIKVRAWQRGNDFLRALLTGYLEGDGHYDATSDRWRLGFTRNDRLADDLRTLAARLGLSLRLSPCMVDGFGRKWPAYRGDIRLKRTDHHNARTDGEIVAIRASRAREFWDIGVEDEPHLFALASGVLTHNSKPNPMPESVTDRPTKSHEYIFLLSKSATYYYDPEAIAEPALDSGGNGTFAGRQGGSRGTAVSGGRGTATTHPYGLTRNARSVWTISTQPFSGAHFAVFPDALPERCILAGSRPGDTVCDPFTGSGTTGVVALRLGRSFIGCELSEPYAEDLARPRLRGAVPLFASEVP